MNNSEDQLVQLNQPSERFFRFTFALIGVLVVIGSMASGIFIGSIFLNKNLRSISSLLSCNSCFIGLFYFIFHLFYILWAFYPLPTYRENSFLCRIIGYFYSVTCCGISWSHAILAINRLCYSMFSHHRWLLTYRFTWRLIIFHWILAFLLPFPLIFFNAYQYQPESHFCILTTRQTTTSVMGVFLFYNIPLTIMMIIYILIWSRARRTNQRQITRRTRDFAILRHILSLVLINIICGHPYIILIVLDYFDRVRPEWFLFSSFFITFSVTANMFAILIFHRKLRRFICTQWTCLRRPASTTSKSTSEGLPIRSPIQSLVDGNTSFDLLGKNPMKIEILPIQESLM